MKNLILLLFLTASALFAQNVAVEPVKRTGTSNGSIMQGALHIGAAGSFTVDAAGTITWTTGATFSGDEADFRAEIGAGTSNFDGAFSSLSGKPTTLSGYGISDAYTTTQLTSGTLSLSLLALNAGSGGIQSSGYSAFGAGVEIGYATGGSILLWGTTPSFRHTITSAASGSNKTIVEPNNSGYHPIVADSGGAINLSGSEVTGTLPYTKGGTGLPTLGTPGQSVRVNAGATGYEFYTNQVEMVVAVSDESTDITTGTGKITFRMPYAMTLTAVRASVGTAPTGSTIIIDINESGSTIMTTNKLSINASEKTSTTAATAPGITDSALADDAEITIDIDQVGSTIAGAGLKVTLIGTR